MKEREPFYPNKLWQLDSRNFENAFYADENLTKKYKNNWDEFRRSTIDKLIKGAEKGKLKTMSPNASDFKAMEGWIALVNKGPVDTMLNKEY